MSRKTGLIGLGVSAALVLAALSCSDEEGGSSINGGDTTSSSSSGDMEDSLVFSSGTGNSTNSGTTSTPDAGNDVMEPMETGSMPCGELMGLGECGGQTQEAEFKKLNILIVIDKSSSMTDTPDGFGESKWEAMRSALGAALDKVKGQISFGLSLYPYSTNAPIPEECTSGCCEVPKGTAAINVPVESGLKSVPKILDALDETSPGGGTPTATALRRALDYFETGDGSTLEGERYVLLATDGGPNCNSDNSCSQPDECTPTLDGSCANFCCPNNSIQGRELCLDDDATEDAITALKGAGIPTFVIGIPGTEAYSTHLNRFAVAGGVTDKDGPEDYFAVTAEGGVEGLTSVFTNITTQLVQSCQVNLKDTPATDEVNVAVDCEVIPQTSESGSGWVLDTDSDPARITLEGPVCNWIETMGVERVDVVFGCPTIR